MSSPAPHISGDRTGFFEKLQRLGRFFFGASVAAFGFLQLIRADFVRLVPDLPAWIPAHSFWAGAIGALLIAIGTSILFDRYSRISATVLAGLILLCIAFLHVPQIAADPARGFRWTNPCKALGLFGGAVFLAGASKHLAVGRNPAIVRATQSLLPHGPAVFLGIFFLVGGIQHFVYADFVHQLVPAWMPARPFWTYFTGLALIASGLGLWLPPTRRLSAALSGLMIFLWVILLHLPLALAVPYQPNETDGVFEALSFSGIAFMLIPRPSGRAIGSRSSHTLPASRDA
jgi:uncharacterized membrane protein